MITDLKLPKLEKPQYIFSRCTARYKLTGGAKGGGKSHVFRHELIRSLLSARNVSAIVFRKSYGEVVDNVVIPLLAMLPDGVARWIPSHKKIYFPSMNSVLTVAYAQNMQALEKNRGIEYDIVGVEELTQWTFEEFQEIISCLRSVKVGIIPHFIATTNPGGRGHGWVKRLWIDRSFNPGEDPDDYAFVPSYVWDNPTLTQNDPYYIKNLLAIKSEAKRRAYIFGDWDSFKGQFFPEFNRRVHVVSPHIPMNNVVKRVVAFDYGFLAPSAVLWGALLENGQVVIYRELYVTGKLYGELADKIIELTTDKEEISRMVGDRAMVKKRDGASATTAEKEFRLRGYKLHGSISERAHGFDRMHSRLKVLVDPNSGEEYANVLISENCKNLIETLPQMIHDEKNVEDMDTSLEDHAVDAMRYLLMEFGPPLTDAVPSNDKAMGDGQEKDIMSIDDKELQEVLAEDNISVYHEEY